MWEWISENLMSFRGCFKREIPFGWFVIIVVGMMIGTEHMGVSSIVREMAIDPSFYLSLLHLFRSRAWTLETVRAQWLNLVSASGVLYREEGMAVLVGDGVKQSKYGEKMVCVKRHHQASENASKPKYLFGHFFGMVGVLAGTANNLLCVPLSASIHNGDAIVRHWAGEAADEKGVSHIIRIVREALQAVQKLGPSILILDAFFLSQPMLSTLHERGEEESRLTIITRAKSNAVAYHEPPVVEAVERKQGRPKKKGDAVKLATLFDTKADQFTSLEVSLYGKMVTVRYLCLDLLWGRQLRYSAPLRFVLTWIGEAKAIFVCTDTSFSPERILRLYGYRFKIESTIRAFKQTVAGFGYRFWSSCMPKLNRFAKRKDPDPLTRVEDPRSRRLIVDSLRAMEAFVCFSTLALGLLQLASLIFAPHIPRNALRWLRTPRPGSPSEATVADFLRRSFFVILAFPAHFPIMRFISTRFLHLYDHPISFRRGA